MKHPQREEWIPYLFGEADAELKKQLASHLSGCPECAVELAEWRKTLRRLDDWKAPELKRRRVHALAPALSLAAAAAIVLGLGVGLGRWFAPKVDSEQLRAGIETSLRASLGPELRQQVRSELAGELRSRIDEVQQVSAQALAAVKAEAVNASAADTAQTLQKIVSLIRSERAEDQRIVIALFDDLRKQHETDYVSLRKDLETVATVADERIRAAQIKLIELTALNPTSDTP